ncbi:MAG: polysulfide reductase NrfD, partial [Verrucomicrobia bacterium]|nr:polysulfide reductase NrfD [Verrucomicrobiota bacterium]
IYPNEIEIHWSILIVVYPYVTGLVAGAFILASLVKVFNVKAVQPTYRLSLLTALAFLLVAPLPLLLHLGRPERFYEILLTPNPTSAMAMFGFVYAWYLMGVLLLELWFEYRRDLVLLARRGSAPMRWVYQALSLFSTDISEGALAFDQKAVRAITIVGIPSAFLLHGYVGFIFGSVKANPWWGTVLMPIIFIFSAIVSGIALVMFLYIQVSAIRRMPLDRSCLETIGKFLFYALVVDAAIESLDWIHRLYEAEESIGVLVLLASGKLFYTFVLIQVFLGTVIPLLLLGAMQIWTDRPNDHVRRDLYFLCSQLVLIGVLAMRWNVVIGGQLFSKSFHGFTTYKLELIGHEGLFTSVVLLILPFIILGALIKLFMPVSRPLLNETAAAASPPAKPSGAT